MKKTLQYALFLAGIVSLPAVAHVGYNGRNFGAFDDAYTTSTLTSQAVTGNYGWIDGMDADYGDSHNVRAYRFTVLEPTNVTLTFEQAASQVADHLGNVSTSQPGLIPGFSLYQGLAHIAPTKADYDSSDISLANRPDNTEGSFRAMTDWSIGNDPDNFNGMAVPASLSLFRHFGHAYDGTGFGSDGATDSTVSHTFMDLAPGDYSVFVGGADYSAQDSANPNLLSKYGVTGTLIAGVVPEPETYALLLAGLGLMGAIVRRRGPAKST